MAEYHSRWIQISSMRILSNPAFQKVIKTRRWEVTSRRNRSNYGKAKYFFWCHSGASRNPAIPWIKGSGFRVSAMPRPDRQIIMSSPKQTADLAYKLTVLASLKLKHRLATSIPRTNRQCHELSRDEMAALVYRNRSQYNYITDDVI